MTCNDTVASTGDVVLVQSYRGDTLKLSVELTDKAGNPVDVTGWGWRCQLRSEADVLVGDLEIIQVAATSGELQLFMDQLDTAALEPADYLFDLEGTDVDSNVKTVLSAKWRVRKDITR